MTCLAVLSHCFSSTACLPSAPAAAATFLEARTEFASAFSSAFSEYILCISRAAWSCSICTALHVPSLRTMVSRSSLSACASASSSPWSSGMIATSLALSARAALTTCTLTRSSLLFALVTSSGTSAFRLFR